MPALSSFQHVCLIAPRSAGQVQTRATAASVQQSIYSTGPNSNLTQPRSHQSVIFASAQGSLTGNTNDLTHPNTTVSHPVTITELVGFLSRKGPLPEWKLFVYNGDPLQWQEWYGQFKSAIASAPLTADVKLTYLETLVNGKAKATISEYAYCGAMYQGVLHAPEKKF